jgi:hypothetical protein
VHSTLISKNSFPIGKSRPARLTSESTSNFGRPSETRPSKRQARSILQVNNDFEPNLTWRMQIDKPPFMSSRRTGADRVAKDGLRNSSFRGFNQACPATAPRVWRKGQAACEHAAEISTSVLLTTHLSLLRLSKDSTPCSKTSMHSVASKQTLL